MRRLFSWLHYLLLVPVLVALLVVSMLRLGLHGHPAYHQQVETWLQSVLQQPVAIEDFTLQLHGRDLAIDISGARLGHNDLALQRLSLSLDLKTLLLDQQLHLSQVQLFGLQVKFLESADGIWQAQGIRPLAQAVKSPSFSSPTPSALLALLQRAGSLALTDAQLTLVPQLGQSVTINNVSASINSLTADTVALNLQANYPATQGRLGAVAHIRFTEDLSILAAQAQVHLQHLPLQPIWQQLAVVQLANGHISGQAWVHLERQQLQKIHIRNLQLQTDYAGLPVDLQGDLDITRQADVWHMQVANIAGSIADHAWPVPDLAVVTNSRDWQLVSSKMQLAQVAPVLKQMAHLPAKITTPVIELNPQGQVYQPRLHWQSTQPKAFLFNASMQDASVSPWRGIPKISGADGFIEINAKGGKVSVDDQDSLQVHIPKLTSQPWQFDGMQGEVAWQVGPQFSHLYTSLIQLHKDEANLNLRMGGFFPHLGVDKEAFFQMRLGIQELDVKALPAMLPDLTMGTALGDYIAGAARAGRIEQGGITYNGAVGKQAKALGPYAFSAPVWGHARLPKVQYAPGWPAINAVALDFSSNHQAVAVNLAQGQLLAAGDAGLSLRDWQVEVPMLATQDKQQAMIGVSGSLRGDGLLLQKLAKQLPPQVNIPDWITDLNPSGDIYIQGSTKIPYGPYAKGRAAEYDMHVTGEQVTGFWQQQQIALEQLAFYTRVTEQGVESFQAQGLADGHELDLSLISRPQVQQLPTGLPANLWQTYGVDQRPMSWLRLQGRLPSAYALSKLSLSHLQLEPWLPKRPQIDVSVPVCLLTSDQCQVAMGSFKFAPEDVNWPEALKPAPEVSWLWQRQADQQALYIINAQQHMALAIDTGQLTGLGIGLAQIAPAVDTGTHIIGHMPYLDAPYWLGLMQGDDTGAKGLQIPTLQKLAILVEQLQWQDVLLNNAQLNYTLADKGWSFELLSDAAKGQVVSVDDGSPWQVNVDYLRIQLPEVQDEDADVEKVDLLAAVDPALLPDMDVDVLEIMKNQQSYGHWRLKARNQDGKVYLHDIEADLHNSHLSGNMTWGRQGLSHETMFSGRVLSQGVAETLSGWGYSPTIDSSYGALEAQLTWPASPLAFDIEAATGDFDLRIKQGEFFETPNLAGGLKVLSLLDMGRLLQRIRLDFTDIFSDEYQFDSIHAHYNMADGRARTVTPATFKSSSLELNLDGFIDFNSRTIDNDLFITLPVADKLSFVALLAGLPQLSGVLYVVDKLVGDELSTFTTARYRVAGDLDRPDLDLQQIFDANNQPKSLDERLNNVIKFQ